MIYPPINDLVEKTGNKYELVIAIAKRARVIAIEERENDSRAPETSAYIAAKNAVKFDKIAQKPIIRAINDLIEGRVYVEKNGVAYKSEGFDGITTIEKVISQEEF